MRALVAVICIGLFSASAFAAKKPRAPKASKPAPANVEAPEAGVEAKKADASVDTKKRVAFLDPQAGKGVNKVALIRATRAIQEDLRSQGFEIITPLKVAAALKKKNRETAVCGDASDCLAKVGKAVDAGYVINVSVMPSGKSYGVKITLVDAADAKVVTNLMAIIPSAKSDILADTLKQKAEKTSGALLKYSQEKLGAVAKASVEKEPGEMVLPIEGNLNVDQKVRPQLQPSSIPDESAAQVPAATETKIVTSKSSNILPWALIGGGAVVAVGGGLFFGSQANSAVSDYQSGKDPESSRDRAKSKALLADISVGAGVALAAVGAGILIFSGSERSYSSSPASPSATTSPNLSLSVAPNGLGLAASGSF